jgi:hypothetical protein
MLTIGLLPLTITVYAASLDEEAKKLITDYYLNNKILTKCGDSYYIGDKNPANPNEWAIIEWKGVSPVIESAQLTYADKLNGLEWKGQGALVPQAGRLYDSSSKTWTQWEAPTGKGFMLTFVKKDGKWMADPEGKTKEMSKPLPLDCKKIETMTK